MAGGQESGPAPENRSRYFRHRPRSPPPDRTTLGGYPLLFAGTAVVAALASVLVWRIKSVP